ncbi:alpha-L-arabinofuranosidase C-terminal domain-containing protein [Cerasicoccus fimbriatus]|uniref:alpha-L-arabinofuranosidase C-terminal domain-containing protein n=1 Tax=Cerasicoccus fimbriatus TaxID=3014554 RepID=UPI0022B51847|nr:alpha-L-arabinofuranosidase C-terminal domain-containing protein [Cerasicoccus sp. TK19100]
MFSRLTPTLALLVATAAHATNPVQITVHDQAQHTLDPRVFGQFLERPSWGEHGPEEATDAQGNLPPKIVGMLAEMDIPIVRWPGGTDNDYTNWSDMVSNAPGRSPERPDTVGHTGEAVTNRMGYDEYAELARELHWQTIIPVNLLDGVLLRKPLDEAALHAAGLVAYCNAPVGAKLPAGMPDWPAVRAKNGHPEPYDFQYVQLGNETWIGKWKKLFKDQFDEGDVDAQTARYLETVKAYIQAIKTVDPDIQIIMDLNFPGDNRTVFSDPYVKANVDFVAHHIYAPMRVDNKNFGHWMKGKEPVGMTSDEWEYAFNAMPGAFDEQGQCIAFGDRLDLARELGYEVAITEWNWNGWGFGSIKDQIDFNHQHAAAVGVGGYLNGMIRQGDIIKIANQSMLVGHGWGIAAIQYNKSDIEPIYYNAQGAVTTLYNKNHGDQVLSIDIENAPIREQPYMMGVNTAPGNVATVDAVATRSAHVLYLHLVNRDPSEEIELSIDLSAFQLPSTEATLLTLIGVPEKDVETEGAWIKTIETKVEVDDDQLTLTLPPSTVANVKLPIGP